MSLANDHIEDSDIGPLWAKHFSMIGDDVASKVIVLSLVYMIEDKARLRSTDDDWSGHVSQELRRHRIPSDQFWEIQGVSSR
jgi:hypothetical protein